MKRAFDCQYRSLAVRTMEINTIDEILSRMILVYINIIVVFYLRLLLYL